MRGSSNNVLATRAYLIRQSVEFNISSSLSKGAWLGLRIVQIQIGQPQKAFCAGKVDHRRYLRAHHLPICRSVLYCLYLVCSRFYCMISRERCLSEARKLVRSPVGKDIVSQRLLQHDGADKIQVSIKRVRPRAFSWHLCISMLLLLKRRERALGDGTRGVTK